MFARAPASTFFIKENISFTSSSSLRNSDFLCDKFLTEKFLRVNILNTHHKIGVSKFLVTSRYFTASDKEQHRLSKKNKARRSMSSAKTTELKVDMMCEGCVGAVKRILGKMEGVESFDVTLDTKKVTVTGSIEPLAVIEKLNKAGKATALWS